MLLPVVVPRIVRSILIVYYIFENIEDRVLLYLTITFVKLTLQLILLPSEVLQD